MTLRNVLTNTILAMVLLGSAVTPARGTTLIRMGLEDLTITNRLVVVGEVVDAQSYWNASKTLILTEVRIEVLQTLKGDLETTGELGITLMGGTVDELTSLIVGGATLVPKASYVLFMDEGNLPGAGGVLTVRDHSQGVFEMSLSENGDLRAVSQALGQHLVPDQTGSSLVPGGSEGMALDTLVQTVREISARQAKNGR